MIAEIIADAYDSVGRKISRPKKRHRVFRPTFPMGAYVTQPLSTKCSGIEEMRRFLLRCRYVSDLEQFNQKDYWMPPEEFEHRKKGDCDDFALWTWRQLMAMGYHCRFVVGRAGKYGNGHAWVTFTENGKTFLVESLAARLGTKLPRLSTVRYVPGVSVELEAGQLHYYAHENRNYNPRWRKVLPLFAEWVAFWPRKWPLIITRRTFHLGERTMAYLKARGH